MPHGSVSPSLQYILRCGLLGTVNSPDSPISHSLCLQKACFCKVLQGIPGNHQDSWSSCHRLLGAAPLVAFPTTEKQGFARVFHGSSCRSHAGPSAPGDAYRTSTGSHIAEPYVFPTFLKAFGKPSGFRSSCNRLLGGGVAGFPCFPTAFARFRSPCCSCGN